MNRKQHNDNNNDINKKYINMEKNNDITVILPVHSFDDTTKELFGNAVTSVKEQTVRPDKLMIVVPKGGDVKTFVDAYDYGTIKHMVEIVENDGATDFASQFNFGVSKVKTEWFSMLEYDDEYSNIWFKNVKTYMEAYPNVEMFMPIIVDVDSNGQFIGFTNEAVWASSFSDELGVLDNNALLSYQNFNIDGFVMKKDAYETHGGFKSTIKLTFIYEFLLRMTFKDVKIMTIPKFGYKHVNQREGSLFHRYKGEMNHVEANWWLSQAKKEYYFPNEREIKYEG
jgi:hypothetical protein